MLVPLVLLLLAISGDCLKLTKANWHAAVSGKTAFIAFVQPGCPYCFRMAPEWQRLMDDFKDSKSKVVAVVDCSTQEGDELCKEQRLRGYPTMKHGDPDRLQLYHGARLYDELKAFADNSLGPVCGPRNVALCDPNRKKLYEQYSEMPISNLQAVIASEEEKIQDLRRKYAVFADGWAKEDDGEARKKNNSIEAIPESDPNYAAIAEEYEMIYLDFVDTMTKKLAKEKRMMEDAVALIETSGLHIMKYVLLYKERGDATRSDNSNKEL